MAFYLCRSFCKLRLAFSIIISLFSFVGATLSDQTFITHGIRDGGPESVLPAKAILHFKIQNLQKVLENLESILQKTLPHEALPDEIRHVFEGEKPLLMLLGMPLFRDHFTSDSVAEHLGFDSESTITLTFYPGDLSRFFVLSAGLANVQTFAQMLSNAFGESGLEEVSIGGRRMLRLKKGQDAFYILTSKDRAYLSGEPSLLLHLHQLAVPSLEEDLHMKGIIKLVKEKDIALTFNPELIKPFITQLPLFKYLPLTFLAKAREAFLEELSEPQKEMIEREIQFRLGVGSLEEMLDYVECIISASYEQIFDGLYNRVEGLKGGTIAINVDHAFPQLSFYLHHDHFKPENHTAPIPLKAVKKALTITDPHTQCLWVSGQKQPNLPSEWIGKWIDRVRDLISEKRLDTKIVDAFETFHKKSRRLNPIEAKSPWTLHLQTEINPRSSLSSFDSIEDWIADLQSSPFLKTRMGVNILPEGIDFLGDHFRENIDVEIENRKLKNSLFRSFRSFQSGTPFFFVEQRLDRKSLSDGVIQWIIEDAYLTHSGFFGYNQHELINRKIYHARSLGDYLVYHQASGDPNWLQSLSPSSNSSRDSSSNSSKNSSLNSSNNSSKSSLSNSSKSSSKNSSSEYEDGFALKHLFDRLPDGINGFFAYRGVGKILDSIAWIEEAEALIHRDIEKYLDEVKALSMRSNDRETLMRDLHSLPFSPAVAAINQDASGNFYCLLPGNLTFPRKRIVPVFRELFEGFEASVKDRGGMIAYSKIHEIPIQSGTQECTIIWNVEGISTLIQTFGNALSEKKLLNSNDFHTFMKLMINEKDRDPNRFNEIILHNPTWLFLDQIKLPFSEISETLPKTFSENSSKTIASPEFPIEARDEKISERHIDLGSFFNASLDETWQKGGVADNDLRQLPKGLRQLGKVKYDLRGILQLTGKEAQSLSVTFPSQASGIKINQKADRLHFLHACAWSDPEETHIASYHIHYADGQSMEIPIQYGIHLRDWWRDSRSYNSESNISESGFSQSNVVWTGSNVASSNMGRAVDLYHFDWENPRSDTTILSLDFHSKLANSAPFLLAITVERE